MARLAVIAIVIAGFFLTGDISTLVLGGRQLATGVTGWLQSDPSPRAGRAANHQPPSEGEARSGQTSSASPVAVPAPAGQPAAGIGPPPGPKSAGPPIPVTATNRVRVSELRPGDRLVLWCGDRGAAGGVEMLAVDLIDPSRGEALLSRQLDTTTDLHGRATTGRTPQRVVLETQLIERGRGVGVRPVSPWLAVRPTSFSQPATQPVWIGPVVAIQLVPLAE